MLLTPDALRLSCVRVYICLCSLCVCVLDTIESQQIGPSGFWTRTTIGSCTKTVWDGMDGMGWDGVGWGIESDGHG
jgi:hypothetical protein